ncbi:hypothetical protein AWZ03_012873 [Drosophila navojoa]|uniref:Uncharacterized protein n=1 Tax=Drosophila navojoa TaxID=7232 RepID=A0A484AWC6_DRONA|nr:hypothetical protein AWZ03_012873 [Drosophila navojoa]
MRFERASKKRELSLKTDVKQFCKMLWVRKYRTPHLVAATTTTKATATAKATAAAAAAVVAAAAEASAKCSRALRCFAINGANTKRQPGLRLRLPYGSNNGNDNDSHNNNLNEKKLLL